MSDKNHPNNKSVSVQPAESLLVDNPVLNPPPRTHTEEGYFLSEVQLANRNSGILLEALRHDVTPIGLHYLLTHFDVPYVAEESDWRLEVEGLVNDPLSLDMQQLKSLPPISRQVTLECAGNGRVFSTPRWPSMPWICEAVGTAEWVGTRLCDVLSRSDPQHHVREWVFTGADRGVDGGQQHNFARSLSHEMAMNPDVMLVWQINGQPLPPQHGYPLRLIVPGWYGMASVKWLNKIEAIDHEFAGYQQVNTYRYRKNDSDPGRPVSLMRVKSLMVPPGIPDFLSRVRLLEAGEVKLAGRAWSGGGLAIEKVEVGIDGQWSEARIVAPRDNYAWSGWELDWHASVGRHELSCRATDSDGNTQPLEAQWDRAGFGNNCVQRVEVWVEESL